MTVAAYLDGTGVDVDLVGAERLYSELSNGQGVS